MCSGPASCLTVSLTDWPLHGCCLFTFDCYALNLWVYLTQPQLLVLVVLQTLFCGVFALGCRGSVGGVPGAVRGSMEECALGCCGSLDVCQGCRGSMGCVPGAVIDPWGVCPGLSVVHGGVPGAVCCPWGVCPGLSWVRGVCARGCPWSMGVCPGLSLVHVVCARGCQWSMEVCPGLSWVHGGVPGAVMDP